MRNIQFFLFIFFLFCIFQIHSISFLSSKKINTIANLDSNSYRNNRDQTNKTKESKNSTEKKQYIRVASTNNSNNSKNKNSLRININSSNSNNRQNYNRKLTQNRLIQKEMNSFNNPSDLSFITKNKVLPKPFYHPDKSFLIQFLPPSTYSIYSTPSFSSSPASPSKLLSINKIKNKNNRITNYIEKIEKKYNTKVLSLNLEDTPELFQFITNFNLNYFNNYPIFYNRKSGSIIYGDFSFKSFDDFVQGKWDHESSHEEQDLDEEESEGRPRRFTSTSKLYNNLNLDSRREFDIFDKLEEKLIDASIKTQRTSDNYLKIKNKKKGFLTNLFSKKSSLNEPETSAEHNYEEYIPKKFRWIDYNSS